MLFDLFFPAPAATPTPAVPVATLSPSASDPSEKQASGDSLPVPRSSRLSSGGDERGAGLHPWVTKPCPRCDAAIGVWCRINADGSKVAHKERM